jgi:hypothetical protein
LRPRQLALAHHLLEVADDGRHRLTLPVQPLLGLDQFLVNERSDWPAFSVRLIRRGYIVRIDGHGHGIALLAALTAGQFQARVGRGWCGEGSDRRWGDDRDDGRRGGADEITGVPLGMKVPASGQRERNHGRGATEQHRGAHLQHVGQGDEVIHVDLSVALFELPDPLSLNERPVLPLGA